VKNEPLQSLAKWGTNKRGINMEQYDKTRNENSTIEVCIRTTTSKDGSKITEYTVRGNPNTATGKAAWYWSVLETVIRESGLTKERSRGILGILGGR
jgi:Tfp pilus assembly major pilin PilA